MTFDMNWGGGDYPTYDGQLKGADTANHQRQDELNMQKSAFNQQKAMIEKLTKAFQPYLDKNIGFDPAAKAAMTSQFLNNNDSTFNQAGSMVREALGARGNTGTNPGGGDFTRGISGLLGARAGSQSQGLLGLNIQDAQQAIANRFNAGSVMSGNAATLTGPQGVAGSAASSALNDFIRASNTGFLSSFSNSLGGGLGSGLSSGLIGGLGTAASKVGNGSWGW